MAKNTKNNIGKALVAFIALIITALPSCVAGPGYGYGGGVGPQMRRGPAGYGGNGMRQMGGRQGQHHHDLQGYTRQWVNTDGSIDHSKTHWSDGQPEDNNEVRKDMTHPISLSPQGVDDLIAKLKQGAQAQQTGLQNP